MIKGEVYKTASGGHSIQFTEVETLKTRSDQLSSPGRKRRGSDSADDDSRSSWPDRYRNKVFHGYRRPTRTGPQLLPHSIKEKETLRKIVGPRLQNC
ncbi:kinesin-like protein KIF23 [Acropora millepora]|uniref:kinesin-like protein KIF23 n=1 Tax=Acropora millepora TaxID=45264 RepID=UPI001CF2329D|nr:kinesin-like protein KIF23 [Acropora millepora]